MYTIDRFPNIKLKAFGRGKFVTSKPPEPEDVKLANEALNLAKNIVKAGTYDVVILDEINVALHLNLINSKQVLKLIAGKPEDVELVLTGRNAPDEILEIADLVTEMKEVRHPFNKGVQARKGIEY